MSDSAETRTPVPILYRPNVAAILTKASGEIFIAERMNVKGAWQFPQGGVDEGEDFEQALFREIEEEIGVDRKHLSVLERRSGYRYAFQKGRLKYGIYGGQEQTYFRCLFSGKDKHFKLNAHEQEFGRWRWIQPGEFKLDWVPKFKREVYRAVFHDFFQIDLRVKD